MRERTDITSCRECGADIVFLYTAGCNRMPVNADSVEPGDVDYDLQRHEAHWSTCTKPERFRRAR